MTTSDENLDTPRPLPGTVLTGTHQLVLALMAVGLVLLILATIAWQQVDRVFQRIQPRQAPVTPIGRPADIQHGPGGPARPVPLREQPRPPQPPQP